MELFLFLCLFVICTAILAFIHYYKNLFADGRETYGREELVNYRSILEKEVKDFFSPMEKPMGYYVFFIGAFAGFLVSFMGGLYNEHYKDPVFHSAIIPVILYYVLPQVKSNVLQFEEAKLFWHKVIANDHALFMGASLSILTQTLVVYGMYHALSFIWILTNVVVIYFFLLMKLSRTDGNFSSVMTMFKKHSDKK